MWKVLFRLVFGFCALFTIATLVGGVGSETIRKNTSFGGALYQMANADIFEKVAQDIQTFDQKTTEFTAPYRHYISDNTSTVIENIFWPKETIIASNEPILFEVQLNEYIQGQIQQANTASDTYQMIDDLEISEEVKEQLRFITWVSDIRNQQLHDISAALDEINAN